MRLLFALLANSFQNSTEVRITLVHVLSLQPKVSSVLCNTTRHPVDRHVNSSSITVDARVDNHFGMRDVVCITCVVQLLVYTACTRKDIHVFKPPGNPGGTPAVRVAELRASCRAPSIVSKKSQVTDQFCLLTSNSVDV